MATNSDQDLQDALDLLEKYAWYVNIQAKSIIEETGIIGGDAKKFLEDPNKSFSGRARPDKQEIETRYK